MSEHRLFLELALARSADGAFEALNQFAERLGLNGWGTLPMRPLGSSENNRGAVEALASAEAAFFEKVMNGHDAQVDLWLQDNQFTSNPITPSDALSEIARSGKPTTYVIATKDPTPTEGTRRKTRVNLLIVDTGTGIPARQFGESILSIHSQNKVTEPLFAGSYGFGGSTIHRFTDATLIYSRWRHDPAAVAFTVVFRIMKQDWKAHSYQWIHDGSGNALVADFAELSGSHLMDPVELDANNIVDCARSRVFIPQHGTGIKVFGLPCLTRSIDLYDTLRQLGFGIEVPVGLRYGVPAEDDTAGSIRRIYDVVGLRHSLNNDRSASAFPVLHHQTPIPIFDGEATLECWVLGESKRTKEALSKNKQSILQRMIGNRANAPIFITLNGQTHENLPVHALLRNAGLAYIEGNLLIEINCDRMTPITRSENFTSSREHVTRQMKEVLRAEITKYLQDQGADGAILWRLNKQFRDELLAAGSGGHTDREGIERFLRLLKSPIAGTVFSKFALAQSAKVGAGPVQSFGAKGGVSICREIPLKAIPDWLEMRKSTIEQGKAEYVPIRTNALNEYGDAFRLQLPPFLRLVGSKGESIVEGSPTIRLRNGRASFYVRCDDEIPVGTSGDLIVHLDRSRASLPEIICSSQILVVRREHAKPRTRPIGTGGPSTMPEVNAFLIQPDEPQWSRMNAAGIDPSDVAYTYIDNLATGGAVDVLINASFPAFRSVLDEAQKRHRDPLIVKRLSDDYELAIKLATLSDIESDLDELVSDTASFHKIKAASAKVLAVTCWDRLQLMEQRRGKQTAFSEETAA